MSKISYRPDIDGLRALAVVPVVLFHASVPGFSGGYVGVDVFFVISGFLITQIIAREIGEGTFSIAGFYVRRIRRIFPALFVMLAATLAVGAAIFLPDDFEALSETALAAILSASNILFFLQAGYFDEAALVKPLLHTWSLAVEEQFYLCLPLLMLAMSTSRPALRRLVIVLIALGSLALAVTTTSSDQSYAFYRLPPRAWELLAGSLLALGAAPAVNSKWAREGLAALGIAVLLVAVFSFTEETAFPGLAAVAPVLGAAMLIHCAPGTAVGRLLGVKLARGIGQISYSLYLWHWPVIVFTVYYYQEPLTLERSAAVVAASLLLAALSWKFVEQPFRSNTRTARWPVFTGAATVMAVLGAVCLGIMHADGLPQRFPSELVQYSKRAAISPLRRKCHDGPSHPVALKKACRIGDKKETPTIAVWSDSHGVELSYALGEAGKKHKFSILQLTSSACPPGVRPMESNKVRPDCVTRNEAVLKFLKKNPSIRTVVMTTAWDGPVATKPRNDLSGIEASVKALLEAGRKVILVGPTIRQRFDVPRVLRMAIALRRSAPSGREKAAFLEANETTFGFLKQAEREGASVVLPHNLLCGAERCGPVKDGKMLYFDAHHPSVEAGRIIATLLVPLLSKDTPVRMTDNRP